MRAQKFGEKTVISVDKSPKVAGTLPSNRPRLTLALPSVLLPV